MTSPLSDKKACTNQDVVLEKGAVLCCPQPDQRVWDAHPRVYLEADANGVAECPYCGTVYRKA